MAESSKTHHFIPVIIFPSKVYIMLYILYITPKRGIPLDLKFVLTCEVERSHDSLVGFRKEHYTKRLVAGGGL